MSRATFTSDNQGWFVDNLWEAAKELPSVKVPFGALFPNTKDEILKSWAPTGIRLSHQELVDHLVRAMLVSHESHPLLTVRSSNGLLILDGLHRTVREMLIAEFLGYSRQELCSVPVNVKIFTRMPEHDFEC